jgi:hypothetical protein
MKIGIKFLIGVIFLWTGILIGIILKASYNSIEISTYLIVGSNIAMIFLMLITILYMNKSTKEHVDTIERTSKERIDLMKRWSDIKRKQLLKSLIKEFKHNISIYDDMMSLLKK